MNFIKIAAVLFLSSLISGCSTLGNKSGFVTSERNASYTSPIGSMKVFIDASAIGSAGATGSPGANMEKVAQTHSDASRSLVNSFKTKMSEAGVDALVKPFGTVTYTVTVEGSKTSTTLRSQGVSTEKMIESEVSNSQPILIVHIHSSQSRNNIWNGMLGWRFELVDPAVWTSKNNITIWKGESKPVQFGPASCSGDAYKSCADKLAESVIAQLRTEQLIK